MRKHWLFAAAVLLAAVWAAPAMADGTETLGTPSVSLASGTGVVVAGVGTETTQPGQITFNVPGTPKQALLYWTGHYTPPASGDSTVVLGGSGGLGNKTFGRTAAGNTFDCATADYKEGNAFTLSENGTVTSLTAHMRGSGASGSQQLRMMIYATNGPGGSPGTLLATSTTVTVQGTAAEGDVSFPLPSPVALSAGSYFLMQQAGSSSGLACNSVDTTSSNLNYWSFDPFADGPADPGGFLGSNPGEYSFSALYTPASGGGGTSVTGTSIGGPTCFFLQSGVPPCLTTNPIGFDFQTYRADITSLGLVHTGANTLSVSGLNFTAADGFGNDGVGIMVIYDDGSTSTVAGVRDGQDLAWVGFSGSLQTTVPQTITFAPSSTARSATLSTLAASVTGPASGGGVRPNQLVLTFDVGGTVTLTNPWSSNAGPEYDAVNSPVTIPAGASSVSVQAVSGPGTANSSPLPASLAWTAATLTVPAPTTAPNCGLGDFVWLDANSDGIQNDGSTSGVDGVTVQLLQNGAVVATTTTSNNPASGQPGWYHFDITCGTAYQVKIADSNFAAGGPLVGDSPSPRFAGTDTSVDSNGDANHTSDIVTVASGQNPTIDFGFTNATVICDSNGNPIGTILVQKNSLTGNYDVTYVQSLGLNDNSYGTTAVGWGTKGHKFNDLVGSDHAEFVFKDTTGKVVLDFLSDYISQKSGTPSGYASLGASGGDGKLVTGSLSSILSASSSLDRDLNTTGYCTAGNCTTGGVSLLTNSPPTDANEQTSTNPALTKWDYHDTYYVTVAASAFGSAGFGGVSIGEVHNSPSKTGVDIPTPGPCAGSGATALCVKGKHLGSLVATYTGGACSGSSNTQGPDATCTGPLAGNNPVRIVASDQQVDPKGNLPKGAHIYYDSGTASVHVGGSISIAAANVKPAQPGPAGQQLPPKLFVYAYDASGKLIQSISFKTDCSKPVAVGNQFGSLQITGGTNV